MNEYMDDYVYKINQSAVKILRESKKTPVFLYSLAGFVDAGFVAGTLVRKFLSSPFKRSINFASFSTDKFINYREKRGTVFYKDGVITDFVVPAPQIDLCFDKNNTPFLLLFGPEPDYNWNLFTKIITKILRDIKVDKTIGFYGVPFPVPHTRPLVTIKTISKGGLKNNKCTGLEKGRWSLSTSMMSALEFVFSNKRFKSTTYILKTPSYLMGNEFFAGAVELCKKIMQKSGLEFDISDINLKANEFNKQILSSINTIPQLQETISVFEDEYDSTYYEGSNIAQNTNLKHEKLPSADELSNEIENYLVRQKKDSLPTKSYKNINLSKKFDESKHLEREFMEAIDEFDKTINLGKK
jgi:hypothetical protein